MSIHDGNDGKAVINNTPEGPDPAHALLADSQSTPPRGKTADGHAVDDVYLCFAKSGGGQYLKKDDFNSLKDELKNYTDALAKKISSDNNGAAIEIGGRFQALYKSSFCSNGSDFESSSAGTGDLKGVIKLPDQLEVNNELNKIVSKYSDSLNCDFLKMSKELNISAGIMVHSPQTDKLGLVIQRYEQHKAVEK